MVLNLHESIHYCRILVNKRVTYWKTQILYFAMLMTEMFYFMHNFVMYILVNEDFCRITQNYTFTSSMFMCDMISTKNILLLRFCYAYDSNSQYISHNYLNIMLTDTRYISIIQMIPSSQGTRWWCRTWTHYLPYWPLEEMVVIFKA